MRHLPSPRASCDKSAFGHRPADGCQCGCEWPSSFLEDSVDQAVAAVAPPAIVERLDSSNASHSLSSRLMQAVSFGSPCGQWRREKVSINLSIFRGSIVSLCSAMESSTMALWGSGVRIPSAPPAFAGLASQLRLGKPAKAATPEPVQGGGGPPAGPRTLPQAARDFP